MDAHGPADLVVGDGDALGLEELLEGEHRREHARVHHRPCNSRMGLNAIEINLNESQSKKTQIETAEF